MLRNNLEHLEKTVYLYDQSLREHYLNEFSQKSCPYENQVYSFFDLDQLSPSTRSQFWRKHLLTCPVCQKRLEKIKSSFKEVNFLIEKPSLGKAEAELLVKKLKVQLRGTVLDNSFKKGISDFWSLNLRPCCYDFLTCFKRPHIQILITALIFWFILS